MSVIALWEQTLLLLECCCWAVITRPFYCHSPVYSSEDGLCVSEYYLGCCGTHCREMGEFGAHLASPKRLWGLAWDCRAFLVEPNCLTSLLCSSSHLGTAAGTIMEQPQPASANLAFEKLLSDCYQQPKFFHLFFIQRFLHLVGRKYIVGVLILGS